MARQSGRLPAELLPWPIRSEALRFDFNRACALKLYVHEQELEIDRERMRREWEWNRTRSQAQMIATMMWCKHEDTEGVEEGGSRCRTCGAMFSEKG
jgi:hypothetical protein